MRKVESSQTTSDYAPIHLAAKVLHHKIPWGDEMDQTAIPVRRQSYSVGHTTHHPIS